VIVMHGLFDLKDGVQEDTFRHSFVEFSEHLLEIRRLASYRFMRHQAHEGFNTREPSAQYYVSMEFLDMNQAEECWALIEDSSEPLKSLHDAVISKVVNFEFFLSSDA